MRSDHAADATTATFWRRHSRRRTWHAPLSPSEPHSFLELQALFDLEATNAELKGDLRDLWIAGAQVIG